MGRSPRVLIIDDDPDHRFLLTTHLSKLGGTVTSAQTAEDAITAMRKTSFDIVVVDLMLPGMNGWELVNWLRESGQPLAIVTMSVLDVAEHPAADAALAKPFNRREVRQLLERCSRIVSARRGEADGRRPADRDYVLDTWGPSTAGDRAPAAVRNEVRGAGAATSVTISVRTAS